MSNIKQQETRIEKLAEYLIDIVNDLLVRNIATMNYNMLSKNVNNYSLDKIPTASTVEKWITGDKIYRDVYNFRSRNEYSIDKINNLLNIGFFERFESVIENNNEQGVLPNINGIESIECLNCGTLNNVNDNTAEFDIQIQITYR